MYLPLIFPQEQTCSSSDQYTPAIEKLTQTGGLPFGNPSRDNT
jgi:hypothetical protein